MSGLKVALRYSLLSRFFKICKLNVFKRRWRKKNPHNITIPERIFPIESVMVGVFTYGRLNVINFSNKNKLSVGNYVSIADNVTFIVDGGHQLDRLSTFPFKVEVMGEDAESTSKGNIIVDDDVWIGFGALILSGVHIGQGAVVAAGAVVTSDVPPYAIVGGVPAKVIKFRFDKSVIDYLLTLDYKKFDESIIKRHLDNLYVQIANKDIQDVEKLFAWFPKKSKLKIGE